MSASVAAASAVPLLQRTLCVVYRFYDAFYAPYEEHTPLIRTALDVSIPSYRWNALRGEEDATYRFSALTLREALPAGSGLLVEVRAPNGEYQSHEPILLDLPVPLSTPPQSADFLRTLPLWPTPLFRPPPGETAVLGQVVSAGGGAVSGLKVVLYEGSAPPPGGPFAITDARGAFLFRFPRLRGPARESVPLTIQVSDVGGAVPVDPPAITVAYGQTQTFRFTRT